MVKKALSVADSVFSQVRREILTGSFPKGELLSIYRLAETYGVSRTPVREAVLRLAALGLVEIERNHGVRVKGLRPQDVSDIFNTRILIEGSAAFFAAESDDQVRRDALTIVVNSMQQAALNQDIEEFIFRDRELHEQIVSWGANRKALSIVNQLRDETQSLAGSTIGPDRTPPAVFDEHLPIVDAIMAHDGKAAAFHMKNHLQGTLLIILNEMESRGTRRSSVGSSIQDTTLIFV